jgi:RNA polymerase sigma factor (sigma-70 family)
MLRPAGMTRKAREDASALMKGRKSGSTSSRQQPALGSGALSQSMNTWLQHRLPTWPQVWAACKGRIHSWRVPPRWNLTDWWEEIDAESIAAACHAIHVFDPTRGPELAKFVYHQILASALSRYRQEWTYAIRYGLSAGDDSKVVVTEDRFALAQDEEQLKLELTNLPAADRSLLEHLFWDGKTETEIARGLGISQQAVSKRKSRILDELRDSFATPDETPVERPRRPRRKRER